MIDRGDPTLTCAKFHYFLNTKADKTISFGPGLLQRNKARVPTTFIIQARNMNSENRKSGADSFVVRVSYPATREEKKVNW
jgi:dynein heavy chain, axonemal